MKDLFGTDVSLLDVRDVPVGDQLHLLVHPAFQHLLDVGEVVLGDLYHGLTDPLVVPVPVRDEVVRLVLLPLVEITVKLDPVLSKFYTGRLRPSDNGQHQRKQDEKANAHEGKVTGFRRYERPAPGIS